MEQVKSYLIAVIAAAVMCSILLSFTEKQKGIHTVISFLCGIFMLLAFLKPIVTIKMDSVFIPPIYQKEAKAAAQYGSDQARQAMEAGIKSALESYILDKASSLGVEVKVTIQLHEEEPMTPSTIKIEGTIPKEVRLRLENELCGELGIAKEDLEWIR